MHFSSLGLLAIGIVGSMGDHQTNTGGRRLRHRNSIDGFFEAEGRRRRNDGRERRLPQCGDENQDCCTVDGNTNICNAGLTCDFDFESENPGTCVPCGDLNDSCCGTSCSSGLVCVGEVCTDDGCGSDGQPCCPSGGPTPQCDDGNVCDEGICVDDGCGSHGQPCCPPDNSCDSGHMCEDGTCSTIVAFCQVVADIDGDSAGDKAGYSVSLSGDGNRIAVGAPYDSGKGSVKVYEHSGLQFDIPGNATNDRAGWSVSLSSDGNRLAVGSPGHDNNTGSVSIYERNTTSVTPTGGPLGGPINGEAHDDEAGYSVSLSNNGARVAIGSPGHGNYSGRVSVYQRNDTADDENHIGWTLLGDHIDGDTEYDHYDNWTLYPSMPISLSSDGNRVAVGVPYSDDGGNNAGEVRIYERNTPDAPIWTQLGGNITGENANDFSGWSVSLSANGERVAIGALGNNADNGIDAGHVRVYEWDGTRWQRLGTDIDGEAAGDLSGYSVSMSADGNRVAIGAPRNHDGELIAGHVRVYEWNSTEWQLLGGDIDGEAQCDASGISVSLSADGATVAIGAPKNDPAGILAGLVRVYDQSSTPCSP